MLGYFARLWSQFDRLLSQAEKFGVETVVMPVDEIRLATAFTTLPNQERVVRRLADEVFDHPNMHVRRIAINACRRSKAVGVVDLKDALSKKLSDPEAWVRYDAAWTILEAGIDSPAIRFKLAQIAGTPSPDDDQKLRIAPGNADLQAKVRARQALTMLETQGRASLTG